MKNCCAFLVFSVLVLWPMMSGAGEASYRMSGEFVPRNHSVNGYSQTVVRDSEGLVTVHVSTPPMPVGTGGRGFEETSSLAVTAPIGFELPNSLKKKLLPGLDAYARATAVLRWVNRSLTHVPEDRGPQDAGSVLGRGVGRCSGIANAAAALLIEAGFETRTVSGLLISDGDVIPHRWLECRLPGAGWVASDPTIGFWVVTPGHVAFERTVIRVPDVTVLTEHSERPDLPVLDGRPIRPDRGSELTCRIVNDREDRLFVAVLRDGSGNERRATLNPEAEFSMLLPGQWSLVILDERRVVARRILVLGPATSHSVVVNVEDFEQS